MTQLASHAQLRMSLLRYLLVTIPLVILLGTLSTTLSDAGGYNVWFGGLARPGFAPPAGLVGIGFVLVWMLLGAVLALLLHAHGARRRAITVALFLLQLLLALLWPPVFFAFHALGAALLLAAAMFILTAVLVALLWPLRRLAALLMLAYLIAVAYIAALSWDLMLRNPVAPEPASTDILL